MNIEDIDTLLKDHCLVQYPKEWQFFLEFCEAYFRNRLIENPIVVELGVKKNNQKAHYEKFLGARHIGIDISTGFSTPEIVGDTHDQATLEKLKTTLGGKQINLLFIDASHGYEDVKMDYEMYGPLTRNIIALHDVMTSFFGVKDFWSELLKSKEHTKSLFYDWGSRVNAGGQPFQYGIGLLIKE